MKRFIFLLSAILIIFSGCNKKKPKEDKDPLNFDYYVAVDGNDKGSGSFYDPFKTIQKAVDNAQPGDVICIMEGKYNQRVAIKSSGNINNYITIRSYPDDKVIIDGTGMFLSIPNQALVRFENSHYYIIDGLCIQNSTSCGIFGKDGSSNIIIKNCTISDCLAPGICFGADFIATENIKILDNVVERCSIISREAISLRTVNNFEIANNIIRAVIKESIDVKSGCKNGTIHNNEIYNSGTCAIYLDAGYTDKPQNDGQYNIHVYQNKIINPYAIGIAIASEMGNINKDIYVYNNLIYDLNKGPGSGIKVADHTDSTSLSMGRLENIYIYNNTVYGRAQQGIYVNHPLIKNIVIYNNISANNWLQIKIKENIGIDTAEVIIKNNLSWGIAQSGDFGINAVKEDPQFVDIANGNFELKSTSPAIDKGNAGLAPNIDFNGTPRPQGDGIDIGAFEYRVNK